MNRLRKIPGFILLIVSLVLCCFGILTACGETVEYSVTVILPDDTPVSDVSVLFKKDGAQKASVKTDANGVAKATLAPDEYDLALENLPNGYAFEDAVKTNRIGTPLSLVLSEGAMTYTAVVKLPDGTLVPDATVVWSLNGAQSVSATTDASGTATAKLAKGTYSVTVDGTYSDHYLDAPKTVTADSPDIIIQLVKDNRIEYSVTVKLPDGSPAANAQVVFSRNSAAIATVSTNASGVATVRLNEGNYTVTVPQPPEGYCLAAPVNVTVSASQKSTEIGLVVDTRIEYVISVVSQGGAVIPNVTVVAVLDGEPIEAGITDANGTVKLNLLPNAYTLITSNLPDGYHTTDTPATDEDGTPVSIVLQSGIISSSPASDKIYVMGDIMHDFTVTNYDGRRITLSDLFESGKTAVVLNFWYTGCTWCVREFPAMQQAYAQFSDDVEIVALNPIDGTADSIASFLRVNALNLTFPLAGDTAGVASHFVISGYPTTVIVDRYGAIAFIEAGAITDSAAWEELFETFTADDYRQTFTPGSAVNPPEEFVPDKPDVDFPGSKAIEDAINGDRFTFGYRAEEGTNDAEYAWPWIVAEKDGKGSIVPSNKGYRSSYAIIHSDVTMKAGEVVAFDFLSSTEAGTDILYVLVDGLVIWQISGVAANWDTCYAYVALKDGTYDLTLLYMKDASTNSGDDVVYVSNMRVCDVADIDKTTDILRHCATDRNAAGTAYNEYVTAVYNEKDGFYHADTENGALILADLMHATQFSGTALFTYLYNDGNTLKYDLDGDGVTDDCYQAMLPYLNLSISSDYYGLVPVNEEIKVLLDKITEALSENHHDKEWLETCKYISRYGATDGDPKEVPNPVAGLQPSVAIEAKEGNNHFSLQKTILPVSRLIYRFTPTRSGVYRIYSLSESEDTQAWLVDEDENELADSGYDLFDRDGNADAERNFSIYIELKADTTYYLHCGFYWSGTMGEFEFAIEYKGTSYTVLTNAADGFYTGVLDENDNVVGSKLNSVETILDGGKYYAKNADGSKGNVILVDFTKATRANPMMSLNQIINAQRVNDGNTFFRPFDFTKWYEYITDAEGNYVYDESGKIKIRIFDVEGGVDYTARMLEIAATANENGFVEATEELVQILTLYAEREMMGLDNDWLQFCYYNKVYGQPQAKQTPSPAALEATEEKKH